MFVQYLSQYGYTSVVAATSASLQEGFGFNHHLEVNVSASLGVSNGGSLMVPHHQKAGALPHLFRCHHLGNRDSKMFEFTCMKGKINKQLNHFFGYDNPHSYTVLNTQVPLGDLRTRVLPWLDRCFHPGYRLNAG